MKINKLEQGMRGMFVDGKIVDISATRKVNTRNGLRSVADATLDDNTGRIKLSLWEDMIEKVIVGDEVSISGAYVTEFRNELQLNIARCARAPDAVDAFGGHTSSVTHRTNILACYVHTLREKLPSCTNDVKVPKQMSTL